MFEGWANQIDVSRVFVDRVPGAKLTSQAAYPMAILHRILLKEDTWFTSDPATMLSMISGTGHIVIVIL
jgi:hypothetical protein